MTKRVLVLVEGQTEERFVKDLLGPAFHGRELFFFPTILVTKRVKDGPSFKGGVTNFAKFQNDVQRLRAGSGGCLVTTMLDYYGLPSDFPGMANRPAGTIYERVEHVEDALRGHFAGWNTFLPFLALHEFEAWLFSTTHDLPRVLTRSDLESQFSAIRASVGTPEEINDRPQWAPSKRISTLFPAYQKTLHGPTTAARIGIDRIRAECRHFAEWIEQLDIYAAS